MTDDEYNIFYKKHILYCYYLRKNDKKNWRKIDMELRAMEVKTRMTEDELESLVF